MEYIENRTFDEINVGDSASLSRTLTREDIDIFAVMSGDVNPAHVDPEYARSDMFHKIVAHGMWGATLISALLGTKLPGPGAIYLSQDLRFRRPVTLGDTITVTVTAAQKEEDRHRITFDCTCTNQNDEVVISGTAVVIAPTEKVKRPRAVLPEIRLHEHGAHLRQLIESTKGLAPIRVGVVNPVERSGLLAAINAAEAGLIVPVLIGPEAQIRAAAAALDLDLSQQEIVPAAHGEAATEQALAMVRAGEVAGLIRGDVRVHDMMKAAVDPGSGLRTDRRMSHIWLLDVPTYSRPLLLTDAMLNISPSLKDKRDIVQNAIDLAHVLGVETPKVAVLAAVETVEPAMGSTVDAAALHKMSDRGQITGGLVDGPMGFDSAVSPEVARIHGPASPVAGKADILVVPDLESGNMLVEQIESLADAEAAGIVLGGRVPIVLAGERSSPLSYMASCALALLWVHKHQRRKL